MESSFDFINEFLKQLFEYGPIWIYLALLVASFIENIFPPFPGDFFTIAAGALAASGWLNIFWVFVMVYIGGIGSTILVYYFGKKYGRSFFMERNYKYFSNTDILKMESWFINRGVWLLIFSRFVVGARAAIAVVGGISNYEKKKFILFSSISFWLFNGIILFSSYIFVVNYDTIADYFHAYEKIAWPIIILAITILLYRKVRSIMKSKKYNKSK